MNDPSKRSEKKVPKDFLTPSYIPASRETSRVMTGASSPEPHLGWFSRGYLPHWDQPGMMQSLTFRLHDSLWKAELGLPLGAPASPPARKHPKRSPALTAKKELNEFPRKDRDAHGAKMDWREIELRKRIARYEDAGHGSCWLRQPLIRRLVEEALLKFDSQRYRLLAWCVMPNHVHVMVETQLGFPVPDLLHSWKSYTANEANKLLDRKGEFWQREYLDRYIRNAGHFSDAIRYIDGNAAKAGLVKYPADWPFTSAKYRQGPPPPLSPSQPAE